MELNDYLRVLRKFWASITALTLIGVSAAAVYSLLATPTYTATTSLFISVQSASSAGELASGSNYAERQVKSFAEVAVTPIVLQPVIDRVGLAETPEKFAERITVTVPSNTSILSLEVEDVDPVRAATLAGAVADSLVSVVKGIAPKDARGAASVEATIVDPASVPTKWTSPKLGQNLVLGLLLGLFLGLAQALMRHVLDTKVRNLEDLASVTDVPVVGTVAWDPEASQHPLAVLTAPTSMRAEEYRRLRTNLQFLGVNDAHPVIAFSSSVAGEGKTSTITNVALALTSANKRVLLIDADLRRPRVAERLNLEGSVGLTTILIGRATLEDVVQPVGGLDVLPSGQVPPNPSELLGSATMRDLVSRASVAYDYVLIDSAPLVPVADTSVLSSFISGVVLVVGSGTVDGAELQDAIDSVAAADGRVLGLVLNKLRAQDAGTRRSMYHQRQAYSSLEVSTTASTAVGSRAVMPEQSQVP